MMLNKKIIISLTLIFYGSIAVGESDLNESVERMTVVGERLDFYQTLSDITAYRRVTAEELIVQAENLSAWADILPGVSLNGQGGLMQTISIRGFSKWRVQTWLDGIPIYTERRAGGGAEFVTPELINDISIVPGAASTYFGSGAIGGAVEMRLKDIEYHQLSSSAQSNGGESMLAWQQAFGSLQIFLQGRSADNSVSANGVTLFDQYDQSTLFMNYKGGENDPVRRAWILLSDGNDIGKSNDDYPHARITYYPRNDHMAGKLGFAINNLPAAFYIHKSQWHTYIDRVGVQENWLENRASDAGFYFGDQWHSEHWHGHWRVENHTRQNVEAIEQERIYGSERRFEQIPLQAEQWDSSVMFAGTRSYSSLDVLAGVRIHHSYQSNNQKGNNEWNSSVMLGFRHLLAERWNIRATMSSAYRIPSLTERYFSGSTPRAQVLGNPGLKTETSFAYEFAVAYHSPQWQGEIAYFNQTIEDYIEREALSEEVLRYENIVEGMIEGASYSVAYHGLMVWSVQLSGHVLEGRDVFNQPLADINPNEHRISLTWKGNQSALNIGFQVRQSKDEAGQGEQVLGKVMTLEARWDFEYSSKIKFSVWGDNITDRLYRSSADTKASWARGRRFGLSLRYRF